MIVTVKHSSIVVDGYTLGDCPTLEGIFSVWNKLTHKSEMKILHYDEENKKLYVPRGVNVVYLCKLLGVNKPNIEYAHTPYDTHHDMMVKYLPRDEVQKEALRFMIGKGEYLENAGKSQLSLNLNTGKGKTYCSIANTCIQSGIKSAIIASSLDWLKQWRDCILEYTNTLPSEIYMISGSSTIHRVLKVDTSKYKFILISHDTIRSYGEKNGWNLVSELFKHLKVGIKYYDESHLYFSNIAMIDYHSNVYRTYYVTATPQRSDKEEDRLYGYYFKTIPSINLFDASEDPHTHYIAIRYNSNPSPIQVSKCRNGYGFDKNKYCDYIIERDNYYKMLRIVLDIAARKNKTIIYIAKNSAIAATYEWIISEYPEMAGDVSIFNSTIEKSKKAKALEKKIILSTTKSLGTAQDIKGLDLVVVLAEPFNSEVLAKQTLGRTRDDDTSYIEIVDMGFPSIKRYLKDKEKVFTKYAKSTSVIDLSQKDIDSRVMKIVSNRNLMLRPLPIWERFVPVSFQNTFCPVIIKS